MSDDNQPDLPAEMPATFRAALDAAFSKPVMLLETAAAGVRASAAGFRPKALEARDGGDSKKKPPPYSMEDGVAVIDIMGPLAQRAWSCWMFSGEGYDAIGAKVAEAMADRKVDAVVLRIDSPGGEVAGCFDALRSIRAAASASRKPIVAYANEMACSAAYAIACAADAIVVPDTGVIGSIGVITVVGDRVEANKAEGLNLKVIRSGSMKAVPHPDEPLSKAGVDRVQADVDALASIFASEVAASRRNLSAEQILGLQAAAFLGAEAVQKGLADRVGNMADAIDEARRLASARKSGAKAKGAQATAVPTAARVSMSDEVKVAEATGQPNEPVEGDILIVDDVDLPMAEKLEAAAAPAQPDAIAALEAKLAEVNAKLEAAERKALYAQHSGKLTPALKAALDKHPVSVAADILPAVVSVGVIAAVNKPESKEPAPTKEQTNTALALLAGTKFEGKTYEQLGFQERADLYHENREAFDALRADYRARTGK